MARAVIAYAHALGRREIQRPLAVLAEDDHGVYIAPVKQDLFTLALRMGRHECAYVGWNGAARGRVHGQHPFLTRLSASPPGAIGPDKLEYFTQAGLSEALIDAFHFGPIQPCNGNAEEIAETIAAQLAAPTTNRSASGSGADGGPASTR